MCVDLRVTGHDTIPNDKEGTPDPSRTGKCERLGEHTDTEEYADGIEKLQSSQMSPRREYAYKILPVRTV